MKLRDITVLVTGCGAQYSAGQLACLRLVDERKIKIVGADMTYDSSVLSYVDVLYKTSPFTAESYVDELLDICKKEQVDVLLPTMSPELKKLFESKERFEQIGVKVSVTDAEIIDITTNKLSLYKFMKEKGLYTPKFCSIKNVDELDDAVKKIGYPNVGFCIKALSSAGSRGIRIVNPSTSRLDIMLHEKPNSFFMSYEDLKSTLAETKELPEMMIMEYLPGMEYSVDLVADHGEVLYMAGRETNVNLASIPQEATLKANEEAYEIARNVIRELKLDGNADLDFKFDADGHPVLMEINPRVAATMQIFARGGINLMYLRIKQLLGEELPSIEIKYGLKMRRRYLEMFE